jgi:dynein heavy chain
MEEVNYSFEQLEEGNEQALREYNVKQIEGLSNFVTMILGELTSNDRKKIVAIVTVDVHARDVVTGLIDHKAENNQCFEWMSQLKFSMDEKKGLGKINICDYECYYGYEYIGNCGCLVVTPLTDRCYITLTQAMRLCLGGAPAGPAGVRCSKQRCALTKSINIATLRYRED